MLFTAAAADVLIYLQNEDKVVHRLVSLEEVVLRSMFALGVELEFLHNAGMLDETQQNLLRQVTRPERLHLYKTRTQTHTHKRQSKNASTKSACMEKHIYGSTCSQEAVCGEQQLWRDLHLQLIFC